ncbi:hypothetical protein SAMN02982918_3823 [Saccharomonospora viridis]|nr:hypothetical protein SAMN02982918_3823 [Saccharomonospora viridis]
MPGLSIRGVLRRDLRPGRDVERAVQLGRDQYPESGQLTESGGQLGNVHKVQLTRFSNTVDEFKASRFRHGQDRRVTRAYHSDCAAGVGDAPLMEVRCHACGETESDDLSTDATSDRVTSAAKITDVRHARPFSPFSGSFSTAPFENAAASHRGVDELACKPDSVHARLTAQRWATIHLGLPSPTGSSGLPAGIGRAALKRLRRSRNGSLLALLRVGFTEPPRSPEALVVSYTTLSPLPGRGGRAVCFLWHFPAGHPGLLLATTLPCGVRTFLGRRRRDDALGRGRPANSSTLTRIPRKHRGPRGAGIGWAGQVPKLCTGGRVRAAEHGPGHSYSRLGSQLRWDVSLIKRTEALPSG